MIRRRLERLEAIPPPPKWKYNTHDLAVGWGGMTDEEREFLSALTLKEAHALEEVLSRMPLPELKELAAEFACARYMHYCRVMRHWDAPDPEPVHHDDVS